MTDIKYPETNRNVACKIIFNIASGELKINLDKFIGMRYTKETIEEMKHAIIDALDNSIEVVTADSWCKWKNYLDYPEEGTAYSPGCSPFDIVPKYCNDYVFCPFCGKLIKYIGEKK